MSASKLVLWKTRRQRLADFLIYPLALVPIEPAMRLVLGDAYIPPYGLAFSIIVLLLSVKFSAWLTARGGEWITHAERTQRLIHEAKTSGWGQQFWVYALVMLVTSQGLNQLILHRMTLRQIYATPANLNFGSYIAIAFGFFGMPMFFFFSGMVYLETRYARPWQSALIFGTLLLAWAVGNLVMGCLMYFVRRTADPER